MRGKTITDQRLQVRMREVIKQVEQARQDLQERVDYVQGSLRVWQKHGGLKMKGQVLIVDGDAFFRDEIGQIVQSEGYRFDMARDAVEAASYLQLAKYKLVIVDLILAKGSGWDVLKKAPLRFPGAKVIILVRNRDEGMQAMRMGAFCYLVRPFDMEQLRACLTCALRLRYSVCEVALRGEDCDSSCSNNFLWTDDNEIEFIYEQSMEEQQTESPPESSSSLQENSE